MYADTIEVEEPTMAGVSEAMHNLTLMKNPSFCFPKFQIEAQSNVSKRSDP